MSRCAGADRSSGCALNLAAAAAVGLPRLGYRNYAQVNAQQLADLLAAG